MRTGDLTPIDTLRRNEISQSMETFMKMNPWCDDQSYIFEHIGKREFKKFLFADSLTGLSARKKDDVISKMKRLPVIQIHGYRGTGKSTFVNCLLNPRDLLDFESTVSAADGSSTPPSDVRVKRMFSKWINRRMSESDREDVFRSVAFLCNDSGDLWANLDANGEVRPRLAELIGSPTITREEIDTVVHSMTIPAVSTMAAVIFAAIARLANRRRTVIVYDNLDHVENSSVVADILAASETAINALRKAATERGLSGIRGIRMVFVVRTRTWIRMQEGRSDFTPNAVGLDGTFSQVGIFQKRVDYMESKGLKADPEVRRARQVAKILNDEELKTDMHHLFNGNYRTFVDVVYRALVKRGAIVYSDPSDEPLRRVSDSILYGSRSQKKCARNYIRDLVLIPIMTDTDLSGHLSNYPINSPGNRPGPVGSLNIARAMLNVVYSATHGVVDVPGARRLKVRSLLEEMSRLQQGSSEENTDEAIDCLMRLHGKDASPSWARPLHIHGITELTKGAIMDGVESGGAYVQISTAGAFYLETILTSLSVFVAVHTRPPFRSLYEPLFDNLAHETCRAMMRRMLSTATMSLKSCGDDLYHFARTLCLDGKFTSIGDLCSSHFVFKGQLHQERLSQAFSDEIMSLRDALIRGTGELQKRGLRLNGTVEELDSAEKDLHQIGQEAMSWHQ